jgi:CheY-like chemotaxis protein
MILTTAGYEVIAASNGLEGISIFRSSPRRFALILTDLRMPVMDGNQLVHLVRETTPEAKIICMSGYTEDPIPGKVVFVQKPFQPARLLEAVKKVLHEIET